MDPMPWPERVFNTAGVKRGMRMDYYSTYNSCPVLPWYARIFGEEVVL
jgi:hypothetical protein